MNRFHKATWRIAHLKENSIVQDMKIKAKNQKIKVIVA